MPPVPPEVGGTHCCPCPTDGETEVEEPALDHTGARPRACSLYHTVTHSRPAGRAASSWYMSHTAYWARELTVSNCVSQTIEGSIKGALTRAFYENNDNKKWQRN